MYMKWKELRTIIFRSTISQFISPHVILIVTNWFSPNSLLDWRVKSTCCLLGAKMLNRRDQTKESIWCFLMIEVPRWMGLHLILLSWDAWSWQIHYFLVITRRITNLRRFTVTSMEPTSPEKKTWLPRKNMLIMWIRKKWKEAPISVFAMIKWWNIYRKVPKVMSSSLFSWQLAKSPPEVLLHYKSIKKNLNHFINQKQWRWPFIP